MIRFLLTSYYQLALIIGINAQTSYVNFRWLKFFMFYITLYVVWYLLA